MVCERPFMQHGLALPCGKCLPCRMKQRRVWTHRIMLEAAQWRSNAFVTLTYADSHLPQDGCVSVRAMQLFIKRLRSRGRTFRYYCVGEYGEETLRPHYHLALFNFDQCYRGQTDLTRAVCCKTCTDIAEAWQRQGSVQVAFLEPASAAYIAGYVTKKATRKPLPPHLAPEFQRVSTRPGIAHNAMYDIADVLLKHNLECSIDDVPHTLQHGTKHMPLGRYCRGKLRKMIGRDERCPQAVLEKAKEELRPLRESAFVSSTRLSDAIVERDKGKIASVYARQKIREAKRHL